MAVWGPVVSVSSRKQILPRHGLGSSSVHGRFREDLQELSSISAAKLTLEAEEETHSCQVAHVRLEFIHKSHTCSDTLKPAPKLE